MAAIVKVVLTGGPCGGKTSFMNRIDQVVPAWGYKVFRAHEAAAELISSGIVPWEGNNVDFQRTLFAMQVHKEQLCHDAAARLGCERALIVCDRGLLDNKAYLPLPAYHALLHELFNMTEDQARDRYDGVIHLVTAANGAPSHYIRDKVRTEEPALAIERDQQVLDAWAPHRRFVSIDNSTGFEQKMERAVAELQRIVDGA